MKAAIINHHWHVIGHRPGAGGHVRSKERDEMTDHRRLFRIFFVLLAFGVVSLLRTIGRPSLANVRAVDIVQLIGTGMCLGGALVALVLGLTRQS